MLVSTHKKLFRFTTEQARKGLVVASEVEIVKVLLEMAEVPVGTIFHKLATGKRGLSSEEAHRRHRRNGPNEVVKEKRISWLKRLAKNLKDPLSILLVVLASASLITKDYRATVIILVMVIISVYLRLAQEVRADAAEAKLKKMVRSTAMVIRNGMKKEIALSSLVPGDIVHLSAGDMVPADVRIIESKELFINQATLTGESMPVEKHADLTGVEIDNPLEKSNLCFLGTNVEVGTALAVVIHIGPETYLGALAKSVVNLETDSNFDKGIKKLTWLIMKFIFVMVPVVFLFNGISKNDWLASLFFAIAVAIGLAPEMLPMIVTVNLSRGAVNLSRQKVIVKHLNAIQNLGAMDVLCMDKTGTLTEGRVVLEKYLDISGKENKLVLDYAFINSYYQTGLTNLMDTAILKHKEVEKAIGIKKNYQQVDELPFDFQRRRMSVVVEKENQHLLICKGAVEEVLKQCDRAFDNGKIVPFHSIAHNHHQTIENELNQDGFRVVAVAYKEMKKQTKRYSLTDENNLILVGFLAFLDPPKATASSALLALAKSGIKTKILTGDNSVVTRYICRQVGVPVDKILEGNEIEKMSNEKLKEAVEIVSVFTKLSPAQKEIIITALRENDGHVVGFLGDGINDSPALHAADVGISVDTAADIAKESSDIILLEKDLSILNDGVREGRKTFGNITKYIQMATSSNFGNMFSVVIASAFLPFLPMMPLQIIINNLLYDLSQSTIPSDRVDEEYLTKPRQWRIDKIKKFILYIGPVSSIFDLTTYGLMLYVFNAWANPALFQTGWFVESLLTQTLIIHIIRTNKIPFIQSRARWPITVSTIGVCILGIYLIFSPFAGALGFVALPSLYWILLMVMVMVYFILTQLMKRWFIRRFGAI